MTLKLLKDFNPQKANLCITTSRPSTPTDIEHNLELISNKRTVKTMRASLAGLPLLTPEWISSCLEMKCLTSPKDHMVIHTLPTKVDHLMQEVTKKPTEAKINAASQDGANIPSARFGVTTFAARHQRHINLNGMTIKPPLLLNGISFFMCGQWQSNLGKRKDVQILLREAGASLLSSGAQTVKKMNDISANYDDDDDAGTRIVLLCHDNITDHGSSITNAITKAARNLAVGTTMTENNKGGKQRRPSLLVVNTNWLFDCISCATVLGADDYPPSFPCARLLWQLCT